MEQALCGGSEAGEPRPPRPRARRPANPPRRTWCRRVGEASEHCIATKRLTAYFHCFYENNVISTDHFVNEKAYFR